MEFKSGRVYQHARSAFKALESYPADTPFSKFLGGFFRENRQMGSKDRKAVSRYAYSYFRLGKALLEWPPEKRLAAAEFLCSGSQESAYLKAEEPEWYAFLESHRIAGGMASVADRVDYLTKHTPFRLEQVFPEVHNLSKALDKDAFLMHHFTQPLLFIRVRRGKQQLVENVLKSAALAYEILSPNVLALDNGVSLDQLPELRGLIEVQDLSSQRSIDEIEVDAGDYVWDACAGGGGKSLALLDKFKGIRLLASDLRPHSLRNLENRVRAAGFNSIETMVLDLCGNVEALGDRQFDRVVLDVPCTGSGTWGRTPEHLLHFPGQSTIDRYVTLQKRIVTATLPFLKEGKTLLYITCSVYAAENEEMVDYMVNHLGLKLESLAYKTGYSERADTLFVARLRR